jgi:hypothetical protein
MQVQAPSRIPNNRQRDFGNDRQVEWKKNKPDSLTQSHANASPRRTGFSLAMSREAGLFFRKLEFDPPVAAQVRVRAAS